MKNKFKRLQFDFSNEAVKELDKLMKKTGALNRAEVVKKALQHYQKFIDFIKSDPTKNVKFDTGTLNQGDEDNEK